MFRNRLILAILALAAIVPLVGCTGRRCCGRDPAFYAAPVSPPCPPGPPIHG